jgi:hypothetical protein
MYSMLSHSPVLDDNSGARASSRQLAAPSKPITAPRANSAGTAEWNAQLSQQRVTDVPSQFSK